MNFAPLNVDKILGYGFIGFSLLLAVLAYLLLYKEQGQKDPRFQILKATRGFMIFSIVLCSLAIVNGLAKEFGTEIIAVLNGPFRGNREHALESCVLIRTISGWEKQIRYSARQLVLLSTKEDKIKRDLILEINENSIKNYDVINELQIILRERYRALSNYSWDCMEIK